MCIVLFTTAHPDYALILIDNRDEYVLRPTSSPHWWTHPTSGAPVLSSRDLQRPEQGTWLGLTRGGLLAVLTNYREPDQQSQPVAGARSRGAMVTAWLAGLPDDGGVRRGVDRLVANGGVRGVGGFSMVCGKLRKRSGGVAIVSNRAGDVDEVPIVGQRRGGVWGLSNTVYDEDTSKEWPKVELGKRLLEEAVDEAARAGLTADELTARLLAVLDTDTLPARREGMALHEYIAQLRHSIFIPPIGDEAHRAAMREASARGRAEERDAADRNAADGLRATERPDPEAGRAEDRGGFETGLYGTQRQTVVLVDWDGNVTLVERALWDEHGRQIPRGEGDVKFTFRIEGWDEEA